MNRYLVGSFNLQLSDEALQDMAITAGLVGSAHVLSRSRWLGDPEREKYHDPRLLFQHLTRSWMTPMEIVLLNRQGSDGQPDATLLAQSTDFAQETMLLWLAAKKPGSPKFDLLDLLISMLPPQWKRLTFVVDRRNEHMIGICQNGWNNCHFNMNVPSQPPGAQFYIDLESKGEDFQPWSLPRDWQGTFFRFCLPWRRRLG